MDFEIRKLTPEDTGAAMDIYHRTVVAMHAMGFMQWNADYPNIDILNRDIAAGTAYGGFLEGRLVSCAAFDSNQSVEYEAIPFEFGEPYLVVHRLAVDPQIRRMGLSTRMMDFVEDLARSRGCPAMRLDTCEDNTVALGLYFGRSYIRRGTCHFPGRTFTFIVMEKKL